MKYWFALTLAASSLFAAEERVIIAQIADGNGWKTTLTLVNTSLTTPAVVEIKFFTGTGSLLALPLVGAGMVQALQRTVPPGGVTVIETEGREGPERAGWVDIVSGLELSGGGGYTPGYPSSGPSITAGSANVLAYAVYRQRIAGRPDFEATGVTVSDQTREIVYFFDNVDNYVTSLAVANPFNQAALVRFTFRDPTGSVVHQEEVNLAGNGHAYFGTTNRFSISKGKRGTLTLTAVQGRIATLGLRFNPTGPFTTVPHTQYRP